MTSAWAEHDPRFRTAEPASVTAIGRLDAFDIVFFILVAAITTAGPWLREAGPAGFGAFALYSLFYAALRRTLFELNWFVAFVGIGLIYIALSYGDLLPRAWTVYDEPDSIPMQSSFVWAFYLILCAGRAFFVRALQSKHAAALFAALILLNLVVSPSLEMAIMPIHLQEQGLLGAAFTNLANSETMMLLGIAHLTMALRHRLLFYAGAAFALVSVFFGFSIQIYASFAMFVILHARAVAPWAFVTAIATFTASCILGPLFIELTEFAAVDPNTAIRGYMWYDAIDLFFSSYGLGVGFGRELLSNVYLAMNVLTVYDDADIMMGGIHNSFISMFARLGLLGGVFFALAILRTASPAGRPSPLREPAYFAFFMAYVSCWVNVAVESPMTSVGTALLLGYVMAARDLGKRAPADGPPHDA